MSDVTLDKDRIHEQVEFERRMADQHQPCDSCWMLVQLYDRLSDYEAAVDALERAIPLVEDEWEGTSDGTAGMEWLRDARTAITRLREAVPA